MAKMGRKRVDMTGQRFGNWVCIEARPDRKWLCRCDCGTVREVYRAKLITGISMSCGCNRKKRKKVFMGCDEDCFNCQYDDCIRPDYLCKSNIEVNAW